MLNLDGKLIKSNRHDSSQFYRSWKYFPGISLKNRISTTRNQHQHTTTSLMFPFNSLIEDLQKEILSYLDLKTLGRCASTSHQLEKIVKESPQWKLLGETILEEHAPRAYEGRITNWFQFCKRCKISSPLTI